MSPVRGRPEIAGAVVLFALAGALGAYAAWSYSEVQRTIRMAIEAGQLAAEGSEFDIASFTMSSSGQFAVLAVILAALGWLLVRTRRGAASDPVTSAGSEAPVDRKSPEDDDLDDLLDGMTTDASSEPEPDRPA